MSASQRKVFALSGAVVFVFLQAACTTGEQKPADSATPAAATGTVTAAAPVALLTPDSAALAAPAPDSFDVVFETSKGNFTIRARRAWAPIGVDRFHYLVQHGFFDEARFFRVMRGAGLSMVQFGMNGNVQIDAAWQERRIMDDPVKMGNKKGRITFAKTQFPNSRSTQFFINTGDNDFLDATGFAAFGEVIEGMSVVESITDKYGETPDQNMIRMRGNAYLKEGFPDLDYIKTASMKHH